ncbi:serine hydrolase domain-containing protein [Cryobacterium psychrophilum]|uniref:Class A beta-lactamase-related serine hydrolase n=1 Tax=Cryobacterium psychrophilum TaxID=41988 RepID=A0A4Y8KRR8_9MICO|nr:serine hydrolase domain-containing protein [Cryobacterium psychrophilum]TDW31096.1 D-alanyl-D-alanine carboxypeptidase [Cryobacterium psychrophilum]TFD78604.1 class A beta-lactamase-related serine hydrolase [Cryobacterium psychrophilum]
MVTPQPPSASPSTSRSKFSATDFTRKLDRHLDRITRARGELGAPQVLVRSRLHGIDYSYGARRTPFHAASIGKVATTALMMQLVDEGAVSLDTSVQSVLGPLDGVLMAETTVRQLLDHTSGAADYFEGPVTSGPPFLELVVGNPDRFWEPRDLVEFSRTRQVPIGMPGERFHYSDTGYILAGLVIEAVAGAPFHEVLRDRIFRPLGMNDSWMMWRSDPVASAGRNNGTIAPLWLGRVEASGFRSVSCDWAGGGIVSTVDDLATLSEGLQSALISAGALVEMRRIRHRFRRGIHYGTGLMELRFGEFSFLLRGFPSPTGHIGVLGTHMFYDAVHDAHIVMNFHSTREMVRSFRTLIRIEQLLSHR